MVVDQIEVSIKSFDKLFDKRKKLIIPEYQRPYVWGRDKAEDLLTDFSDHFLQSNSASTYYLGTVLFFYNKKERHFEIIDGQQRISTLLIIKSLLTDDGLPDHQNVSYNSHQSIRYIKDAQVYFKQNIEIIKQLHEVNFFEKLNFTQIITHSEDDAFTFFDTQNNRGVKLGSTDFLKAYHLRAIKNSLRLQEECARQWEKASMVVTEGPFLGHLFDKILWRSRNWKGQRQLAFENKDEILKTFQKQTILTETSDQYPLYPNFFNRRSIAHHFSANGDVLHIQKQSKGQSSVEAPFSLRQPIHKGLNFFKYTEKYAAIYSLLFVEKVDEDSSVFQLKQFYRDIYTDDMSVYLRHFMQLCLISYYDVFGSDQILSAAHSFDYIIGSMRFEKQQIKREAIRLCLTDGPNNLLDVISNSYRPEEVTGFIYQNKALEDSYQNNDIPGFEGVRGRYRARVCKHFNKTEKSISTRKTWSTQ